MILFSRFRVARLATLVTLVVGTAGITLGSACVEDQDLLVVERALWFPDSETCVMTTSDPSPLALVADVSFDTRIGLGFLITNNQVQYEGSNTNVVDGEISLETAEVSLSFSAGAVAESSFEVTVPHDSILPGESDIQLIQIPYSVTQSLRATMQGLPSTVYETLDVEVVFHGRRTGQTGNTKVGAVKTRAFTYPIEICYGCLQNCSPNETCIDVCPTPEIWDGTCGFAQGASVIHPSCATD